MMPYVFLRLTSFGLKLQVFESKEDYFEVDVQDDWTQDHKVGDIYHSQPVYLNEF
jgi:hypothetical protein